MAYNFMHPNMSAFRGEILEMVAVQPVDNIGLLEVEMKDTKNKRGYKIHARRITESSQSSASPP